MNCVTKMMDFWGEPRCGEPLPSPLCTEDTLLRRIICLALPLTMNLPTDTDVVSLVIINSLPASWTGEVEALAGASVRENVGVRHWSSVGQFFHQSSFRRA